MKDSAIIDAMEKNDRLMTTQQIEIIYPDMAVSRPRDSFISMKVDQSSQMELHGAWLH